MYPIYRDLREKLGEPLWHDAEGVPRYAPFEPNLLGIYDEWACLFVVRCQGCSRDFHCAAGWTITNGLMHLTAEQSKERFDKKDDAATVLPLFVGWGDAPWHGYNGDDGQCSGTTMSTEIMDVREIWHRVNYKWEPVEVTRALRDLVTG